LSWQRPQRYKNLSEEFRRIRNVTGLEPDRLDDLDVQDIFVLNLQRAIQSAIDLVTHVVASGGLGIPHTIRGNFVLLESAKVVTKALSKRMQSMVGFRNIAIHDYHALDIEILKAILSKHLKDLEQLYTSILTHFDIARKNKKKRGRRS
jgi:uncharacterized protein YutE (UPF0331/DUF86 family)